MHKYSLGKKILNAGFALRLVMGSGLFQLSVKGLWEIKGCIVMEFGSGNQAIGGHTLYTKVFYINEISNSYLKKKKKKKKIYIYIYINKL